MLEILGFTLLAVSIPGLLITLPAHIFGERRKLIKAFNALLKEKDIKNKSSITYKVVDYRKNASKTGKEYHLFANIPAGLTEGELNEIKTNLCYNLAGDVEIDWMKNEGLIDIKIFRKI